MTTGAGLDAGAGLTPDWVYVARLRAVLGARLGWAYGDNDVPHLAAVLSRRAGARGQGIEAYLRRLEADRWADELVALVAELAITETYFFRHSEQFQALREVVLPRLVAARSAEPTRGGKPQTTPSDKPTRGGEPQTTPSDKPRRVLRLLSVGCSSGEEAYTLAIVAREVQPDPAWTVSVLGLDANPEMLALAGAARYSGWSLRETPEAVRGRWFRPLDGEYQLDPALAGSVRFRRYNVADEDPWLWWPEQYDVVFCRNLLMYLTPGTQAALIARMTRALTRDGFLFLGHTDSLGVRPEGLEPLRSHHTFYYRRSKATAPARAARPEAAPRRRVPAPLPGLGTYERATTLLADERFAEALAVVEGGRADRPQPRDLLLHGVLLAQAGRLDEAELVCHRLLDADGLDADAHHLLAICLEDGAAEVAIGHYRLAAYLDVTFAMPRLRLGLLARRRGDHRLAVPELDRALHLLREERDERILLFGGGFGRAALGMLCRAELDAIDVHRIEVRR